MARYFALVFVVLVLTLAVWISIVEAQAVPQGEKKPQDSKENDHKDEVVNDVWNKISMIIATPFEELKTTKDDNTTDSGRVETLGILLTTFNATKTLPAPEHIKDSNKKPEENEDECDLYGKILAKKLRKYPESMRIRVIYKIDGLLLNNPYPAISSNISTESPKEN